MQTFIAINQKEIKQKAKQCRTIASYCFSLKNINHNKNINDNPKQNDRRGVKITNKKVNNKLTLFFLLYLIYSFFNFNLASGIDLKNIVLANTNSNYSSAEEFIKTSLITQPINSTTTRNTQSEYISPWQTFYFYAYNGITCCNKIFAKIEFYTNKTCFGKTKIFYSKKFELNDLGDDEDIKKEDGIYVGKVKFTYNKSLNVYNNSCYYANLTIQYSKIFKTNKIFKLFIQKPNPKIKIEKDKVILDPGYTYDVKINQFYVGVCNIKENSTKSYKIDLEKTHNKNWIDFKFLPGWNYEINAIVIDKYNNKNQKKIKVIVKDHQEPEMKKLTLKRFHDLVFLKFNASDNFRIWRYLIYRKIGQSSVESNYKLISNTKGQFYVDKLKNIEELKKRKAIIKYLVRAQDCSELYSKNSKTASITLNAHRIKFKGITYKKDGVFDVHLEYELKPIKILAIRQYDQEKLNYYFNNTGNIIFNYNDANDMIDCNKKNCNVLELNHTILNKESSLYLIFLFEDDYKVIKITNVKPILRPPKLKVSWQKNNIVEIRINSSRETNCTLYIKKDLINKNSVSNDQIKNPPTLFYDENKIYAKNVSMANSNLLYNWLEKTIIYSKNDFKIKLKVKNDVWNQIPIFLENGVYNIEISCIDKYGYIINKSFRTKIESSLPLLELYPKHLRNQNLFILISLPESLRITLNGKKSYKIDNQLIKIKSDKENNCLKSDIIKIPKCTINEIFKKDGIEVKYAYPFYIIKINCTQNCQNISFVFLNTQERFSFYDKTSLDYTYSDQMNESNDIKTKGNNNVEHTLEKDFLDEYKQICKKINLGAIISKNSEIHDILDNIAKKSDNYLIAGYFLKLTIYSQLPIIGVISLITLIGLFYYLTYRLKWNNVDIKNKKIKNDKNKPKQMTIKPKIEKSKQYSTIQKPNNPINAMLKKYQQKDEIIERIENLKRYKKQKNISLVKKKNTTDKQNYKLWHEKEHHERKTKHNNKKDFIFDQDL